MRVNSRIGRGLVVAAAPVPWSSRSARVRVTRAHQARVRQRPPRARHQLRQARPVQVHRVPPESLQSAIPNGAKIVSFNCGSTGGGEIAAVKFNPGPTVLFLETKNGKWAVINADRVCGTASAGLPPKVLAYCTTASPTKSASASKS